MLTFRDRGLIAEGAQFMMTYTDVKVQGDQVNMAVCRRKNYILTSKRKQYIKNQNRL